MVRVRDDSIDAWLQQRSANGNQISGFDAAGWEANTWILHAMYERRGLDLELTYDDLHRHELATPSQGTDRDVDDVVRELTGLSLGWSEPREPEWVRLRWSALASRLGITLDGAWPPNDHWFGSRSWPVTIHLPEDGTMDEHSLDRLIWSLSQLDPRGASTPCFAYFAPLVTGDWDHVEAYYGPLGGIPSLADESGWESTPNNFWAEDRSWLAFTDADLTATRVSGSADLVTMLDQDPELETLHWDRPYRPRPIRDPSLWTRLRLGPRFAVRRALEALQRRVR